VALKSARPAWLSEPDGLMARIRGLSPTLSRGQRAVVEFFVGHCDRAVFLTSTQMAREVSVSEATVVRTARALGFSGYPEFRTAFRTYFVERMSTVTRVRLTAAPRRTESYIIDEVIRTDLTNLEATRARLDHKALGQAAEMIGGARHVYVIGMRSAHALAWLLHFSLTLILANSRVVTLGAADVSEQLERVGPEDVVVGITFERYTRATVELFRGCLAKGARGIALTDKPTSPLAEGAAVVLEAQTRLSSFIDSWVGPTALINVLVTLVAAKRRRKVLRTLADHEDEWRRHRTYL
jgi:DNA-binding MurR/RpiR family transcriptional regulator